MKILSKTIVFPLILGLGIFIGWISNTGTPPVSSEVHEHGTSAVYSCSMHPQVRQNQPGTCPLCGMNLVQSTSLQTTTDPNAIQLSKDAQKLANIQTLKVTKSSPSVTLHLNGRVLADKRKTAVQTTHISGQIEQLLIGSKGQYIKAGEIIAYVYSPDLIEAQNELFEAFAMKEAQPELFEATRKKLENWKLTSAQIDTILRLGEPIESFPLVSEWKGMILNKYVSKGSHIERGTQLYEVANLKSVWVTFDLYETDLKTVHVGDKINMEFSSYPGKIFIGQVNFINPIVDPATQVAQIRVIYTNTFKPVYPGTSVKGLLNSQPKDNQKIIILPKTAVLWTGKRSIVYVKDPISNEPTFHLREVTLGALNTSGYAIEKGLEVGEEVVVNGVFTIDAAAQLAGKNSMMNSSLVKTPNKSNKPMGKKKIGKINPSPSVALTLKELTEAYLNIKNALALKNHNIIISEAALFIGQIGDQKNFSADIDQTILIQLNKMTQEINATRKINEVYGPFAEMSDLFFDFLDHYKIKNLTLFRQYCPMAFDNKGAYWLSNTQDIYNPYFGEEMRFCGEVKEQLN
ncbi:efflux RND transporter periplasmic adaptor subunit [Cyclobacteriaceae bacterium]|jgi:Cu(I)/Ag(I) efflux system membrane fusion protein|nr:efflux RND transporter periplasmic adaptor subunit [bacterium]MDC1517202.1 efflux RND transporter periplasmic adaptor subunit [Cyclobacteriaceae bacterium]